MYKFTIEAETLTEFNLMKKEFALDTLKNETTLLPVNPIDQKKIDELLSKAVTTNNGDGTKTVSYPIAVPEDKVEKLKNEIIPNIEKETGAKITLTEIPAPHNNTPIVPVNPGVELDSAGMPHDPRIHSDAKTKLKNGLWRLKKNLEPEVFEKVTKEITTPNDPVVIPPPPPPTVAVEIPKEVQTVQQPVATPQQTASPASLLEEKKYDAIPIPTVGKPAHTCASFSEHLMSIIADLINQGKITQDYIEQLKTYFGIKEIWNVRKSGKQTQELYETFAKCGFITAVD